jgi:hypothetical protein
MQEGGLTPIVGPSIKCQCAMAVEMRPFLRPNIGPMALAKVARCRLHESALGQSPGLPWPERELLLGSFIESLLWGFLPAGSQNDPTERKQSHVTKRMLHIVHIRMYMIYI